MIRDRFGRQNQRPVPLDTIQSQRGCGPSDTSQSFSHSLNKKIIFFAGAGVLWAVLIMSICVISSKLPAQLSLLDFAEGIMEVDLKKQPFAEVAPNIYFHKDGNMDEIINYLSNDGMILDEQFGSSYIFTNGKETIHASTMAITRWHKILILNNN